MQRRNDEVDVWDMPVRVFHWGLVVAFAAAFMTAGVYGKLHTAAGYAVAVLVVFRWVWGVIGTRHARFSDFVKSPATILTYLGQLWSGKSERHLGHNPAGGAMILALLGLCTVLAVTGYMQTTPAWFGNEQLHQFHRLTAWLTVSLIPAHLLGVIISSAVHNENLLKSMFTGRKPRGDTPVPDEDWRDVVADRTRATNVFALLAVLAVAVQWLAPQVQAQIELNERRAKIAAKIEAERLAKLNEVAKGASKALSAAQQETRPSAAPPQAKVAEIAKSQTVPSTVETTVPPAKPAPNIVAQVPAATAPEPTTSAAPAPLASPQPKAGEDLKVAQGPSLPAPDATALAAVSFDFSVPPRLQAFASAGRKLITRPLPPPSTLTPGLRKLTTGIVRFNVAAATVASLMVPAGVTAKRAGPGTAEPSDGVPSDGTSPAPPAIAAAPSAPVVASRPEQVAITVPSPSASQTRRTVTAPAKAPIAAAAPRRPQVVAALPPPARPIRQQAAPVSAPRPQPVAQAAAARPAAVRAAPPRIAPAAPVRAAAVQRAAAARVAAVAPPPRAKPVVRRIAVAAVAPIAVRTPAAAAPRKVVRKRIKKLDYDYAYAFAGGRRGGGDNDGGGGGGNSGKSSDNSGKGSSGSSGNSGSGSSNSGSGNSGSGSGGGNSGKGGGD